MFKAVVDLILPPRCHICGDVLLPGESFICPRCCVALPRTMYYSRPGNPMEMRFAGKVKFKRAASHFFYTRSSPLPGLIHDFKYRNFPSLARRLGQIMGEELARTGFLNDIDYILPLPIHWTRRLSRGYNQTEHLAQGISDATGITVSFDLIARRSHKTQTNLTPEQRRQNTSNLFYLRHAEKYAGKELAILDDVCTTGATLFSAASSVSVAAPGCSLTLLTLGCTL